MLYFIKNGRYVKIGHTNNIKLRLSDLQVANPERLSVIGLIEGSRNDEAELHNKFKHLSAGGEWFYYTEELIDFIQNLETDLMWRYGFINEQKSPIGLIKLCRLEKNISLEELGNLIGVTKQSVKGMEKREIQGAISIKCLNNALNSMGYKLDLRAINVS
jgi:DNA-binding XRE family transcriptional regulator